jgi:two-component system, OmpR family, sensor histidine kinase BaeS
MRTKLFLAFIIIILAALLSTIIFELMILKDFDNYVGSVREDQVYWIVASVEGAYMGSAWDSQVLAESVHWAMMMGLDIKVLDAGGSEIIHAHHVMGSLSPGMKRRMEQLFQLDMASDRKYNEFPIYSEGKKIGTLLARSFQKKELAEKEATFKKRVNRFLSIYLLIAGAGTVLTGLLLTQYLSKPVRLLKRASEKIGGGDFSVRIASASSDEVGDLSKTFNRMAESLQRDESLRKHLMSNIAHELRTPLTIIKTHIEAITDGIVPDTGKGLENIEGEIDRLISLVKGIEDITAAEASFFTKGEAVRINLNEFLHGIVADLKPSFQNRGLYLELATNTEFFVTVDAEKLERVLRNIVSNSLKFTDKGGVSISYGIEGSRFFIDVKDTGRGIPETELLFIFDRFYRWEASGIEGLGLGLAIVKELVDIMGGKITVISKVAEGTSFKVLLPLEQCNKSKGVDTH